MLQIFNKRAITKKQRFIRALVIGTVTSISLAIITAFLTNLLRVQVSVIYLAIGYVIALVIKKQGRGVQVSFSLLGGSLTLLAILLTDMLVVTNFNLIPQLSSAFLFVLNRWLSTNINSLIGLGFRIFSVYYAYMNSRIV